MVVRRIVANLLGPDVAAGQAFYADVFGLQTVMDLGWIATVAEPADPRAQLSLLAADATAPVPAEVSIQVDDVDAAYAAARARGAEIVHPLTDEPWGVRRFFVRDPAGHVVNVLTHPDELGGQRGRRVDPDRDVGDEGSRHDLPGAVTIEGLFDDQPRLLQFGGPQPLRGQGKTVAPDRRQRGP